MHHNAAYVPRIAYYVFFGVLVAGTGITIAPRLSFGKLRTPLHSHAAFSTYTYPDQNILVNRFFEPDDFPVLSSGDAITVTIDVTNNENVTLRGFYYSDQAPNGWVVNTVVQPRYIHVTDVVYNVHLPLVLKQSRAATLKIEVIGGKHEQEKD